MQCLVVTSLSSIGTFVKLGMRHGPATVTRLGLELVGVGGGMPVLPAHRLASWMLVLCSLGTGL